MKTTHKASPGSAGGSPASRRCGGRAARAPSEHLARVKHATPTKGSLEGGSQTLNHLSSQFLMSTYN